MADPHWKRLPAIACLCLACCTSLVHAEDSQSNQPGDVKAKTQNSLVQTKNRELNTENEKLAQNLVEEHLPDLMPLLKQLKSDKSKQYEKAIWDLSRSARKLSLTRKRDAGLFNIELELLKAETDANLIAARLKVRDKPEDRDNLREAVTRLRSAQESKFRYEIKVYEQRLARDRALLETAEKRLSEFMENPDHSASADYVAMLRKAGRKPIDNKKKQKNEAKSASE